MATTRWINRSNQPVGILRSAAHNKLLLRPDYSLRSRSNANGTVRADATLHRLITNPLNTAQAIET